MNESGSAAAPAVEPLSPPRSFIFMILEHFIMDSIHDPGEAERKLMDLEALKEFADAGYTTLDDHDAEKIQEAGLFWVRGAIEAPHKSLQYRDVANAMLALRGS